MLHCYFATTLETFYQQGDCGARKKTQASELEEYHILVLSQTVCQVKVCNHRSNLISSTKERDYYFEDQIK